MTVRVLLAVSLIFVVLWFVSALAPREPSPEALRYFDRDFLNRAQSRAKVSYIVSGLRALVILTAVYAVHRYSGVLLRCPLVSFLVSRNLTVTGSLLLGAGLGILAGFALSLLSLPLDAYVGLVLDRQYGLSRMTTQAWFADWIKWALMSTLMYAGAGALISTILVLFPRNWHLVLGLGFFIISTVLTALYPTLIAPLFDEFHPLDDGDLLSDITRLAEKAGMEVGRVKVMEASLKTNRVNAYFAGLGRTKEVVLYDTLLATHTKDQVLLVVAHELGHWRHNHVAKQLIYSGMATLAALFYLRFTGSGMGHTSWNSLVTSLTVLFIVSILGGYVLNPAANYISRIHEVQADEFSLLLTKDPQTFVSTQINLAQRNLSDVEPPPFIRWFAWTHPTTLERIGYARSFR